MITNEIDTPLPLQNLEIKNFRAFRHLTIPRLGRVNLITGKNNVGKTAVLEAIRLFAERGSPKLLRDLLVRRSEVYDKVDASNDSLLFSYMSLFNMDDSGFKPGTATIGPIGGSNTLSVNVTSEAQITLSFGETTRTSDLVTAFADSSLLKLETDITPCRFVKSHDFNRVLLKTTLADNFQETGLLGVKLHSIPPPLQNSAEKFLRLIEPRLDYLYYSSPDRIDRDFGGITAQLKNNSEGIPLESMGEGMIRLFDVGLALPDLQNGILLIDEIENGLHYSVMPSVWNKVFEVASELNMQVFATTHSWDCIEAFQQVADGDHDPNSGLLIQLRNKSGNVVATVHDEKDLAIITRNGIEVR